MGPSTLHFQDFPRWLLCNPDVVYLFICHFKSSNAEKGIEGDKCLLHPRRTKGTCQFPACAFSRLRRLSQSFAPLLKASSHSFTTRRLLFSEKLGFRVVISQEVSALCGSTGASCMLHLGNFPLLMVGLTAAPWQPVVKIHEGLWRSFVRFDSALGGSSMKLKYMYCVDMPKSLLNLYFNLCHIKFIYETVECCNFIFGKLLQRHSYQSHTVSPVRTQNILLILHRNQYL